jgi:hypothetical protein
VIQRIKSKVTDCSPFGSVIEDIKFISNHFSSYAFQHVYRVLNVAAHQLAQSCISSTSCVWHGVSPECIRETLCNDIMFVNQ